MTNFLTDNYGSTTPNLKDILRPAKLKLSKLSFLPAILGNQIGGIELDRSASDLNFGHELTALSETIISSVIQCLKDCKAGSVSLHFDELDQGITTLDDQRTKMLIGLVIAAREVKRDSEKLGVSINPVIYLRTDIWDELQFSDKNKISQSLTLLLEWDSQSLAELIQTRLVAKLGESASWDAVVEPELMRGSQPKWNHILARTFLRPRDVISFLNIILSTAKKRNKGVEQIINRDIVGSRDAYSNYLKLELDDEIVPHWQYWTEALQACSAISTVTFEREDFEREYTARRSTKNPIPTDEALALLYRFSVIGYRGGSGYGGSSWVFQYSDPAVGWDNVSKSFKVHPGLKEYAKLREART